MEHQRIVLGTDGQDGATQAAAWATRECELRDAELQVVHAPDCLAVETLIESTRGAALLVIGNNGADDVAESILGTIGHRVAVRAHCPVVVVPPVQLTTWHAERGQVILGLTNSRSGRLALRFAIAEARRRGTRTVAIVAGSGAGTDVFDELRDEIMALPSSADFWVERTDLEPGPAVLLAAGPNDLIVLGCHHSEDVWSARLGAVPTAVLAGAPCPVVLVGENASGDHPVASLNERSNHS